jgi:hypothetical protein
MIYAESLFLGAPLLLCAVLGTRRHRWLLVVAAVLGLLATLPEIGGGPLFLTLTGGLVRYPSRFALVAVTLLLPVMGRGAGAWVEGRGRWLAAVLAAATLVLCGIGNHPWRWLVAGVPAAFMLTAAAIPARPRLRSAVLVAGLAGAVVAGAPLLGLQRFGAGAAVPAWPQAVGTNRVYTPGPDAEAMRWLASGLAPRRLWPVGYLNLVDGLTVTRTDAPVANARLAEHLRITDEGPHRRWWLDAAAARWVVLREASGVPEQMDEIARRGGMRLLRNLSARDQVSVAGQRPDPDRPWAGAGRLEDLEIGANRCRAEIFAERPGWLWVSLAPVRGWRWRLDGREVELSQGPGIVQFLPVATGPHRLEGWYSPPGLVPSAVVSGLTALLLLALWPGIRSEVSNRCPEPGMSLRSGSPRLDGRKT